MMTEPQLENLLKEAVDLLDDAPGHFECCSDPASELATQIHLFLDKARKALRPE